MREQGLVGAVRGKVKRTTIAGPVGQRSRDLVCRDFGPVAPNVLWVADMTYVSTWSRWVYVAFVIDAYARRVLGWRSGTCMDSQLVLHALEQAVWTRNRSGATDLAGLIHHTDRGMVLHDVVLGVVRLPVPAAGEPVPVGPARADRVGTVPHRAKEAEERRWSGLSPAVISSWAP